MSSARALAGFKTKGSQAEIVLPVEFSGSNTLEKYDQGVYVNDISALINPSTVRMRPNNDFLKIKDGVPVQITVGSYDDTEAPSSFASSTGSFVITNITTSSFTPYTAALGTVVAGTSPSIIPIGGGVYDVTGSTNAGYAYLKKQFLETSVINISYNFSTSDNSNDDWPFYQVSSTEPTGTPTVASPGLLIGIPPISIETGLTGVAIPAGQWLSLGIRSAGASANQGEVRFEIEQLVTGTYPVITYIVPSSQIPISFFAKSHPQGGKGSGYAVAPSHFQMDNDFGQPDTYQDGTAYEEITTKIDPVLVIETPPEDLFVPFHIVNSSDQTSVDGLVDVFDTRKKVDRDLEIPFSTRDTWGSLSVTDAYRRSVLIEDQVESLSSRVLSDGESFAGTDAFLDAGDEFGLRDILEFDPALLVSGSKSPEGFVKFPTAVIAPFLESSDAELTTNQASTPTDTLWSVVLNMTGSRDFPTHDYLSRDSVSLSHGYDYDSSATRIDSLAFGGLLRR